jgi:MinD-like ATPase involved in chromosome partitioning or flagellar assembly
MKVVTAHSYRGGTGKTNIIANLSLALAREGKNVAAVDSDLTHPSLHMMYGLEDDQPRPTITEFLLEECTPAETIHDLSKRYNTKGKLYLIPAKLDEDYIRKIIQEGYNLRRLFTGLRTVIKEKKLDYMLLDSRPGLDERTLLMLMMTDILLVLTRNDEADFRGTRILLNIVDNLKIPTKYILPSMITPTHLHEAMKEFEKRFKGFNVTRLDPLPFSDKLFIDHSPHIEKLFISSYPSDPYSQAIQNLKKMIKE